jgi:hypothetical protein
LRTLAADLASHAYLRRLQLSCLSLNTAAALDAVADAALMRQLTHVTLESCDVSTILAPALVRLIGSGALAELDINGGDTLVDVPAALAVGNALRASNTLTALSLRFMDLWRDPAAATALLGALTGHPEPAFAGYLRKLRQQRSGRRGSGGRLHCRAGCRQRASADEIGR